MTEKIDIGLASPKTCLTLWRDRALRNSRANHAASEYYSRKNVFFTNLNVYAGIIVLFLGSVQWVDKHVLFGNKDVIISVAGVCIVITTIWQAVEDYGWRAMQHEKVAIEYGRINRKIEEILAADSGGAPVDIAALSRVRTDLDGIARIAVMPPQNIWSDYFSPTSKLAKVEQEFGKEL